MPGDGLGECVPLFTKGLKIRDWLVKTGDVVPAGARVLPIELTENVTAHVLVPYPGRITAMVESPVVGSHLFRFRFYKYQLNEATYHTREIDPFADVKARCADFRQHLVRKQQDLAQKVKAVRFKLVTFAVLAGIMVLSMAIQQSSAALGLLVPFALFCGLALRMRSRLSDMEGNT